MGVDEWQLVEIRLSSSDSQTLDSGWSLQPSGACFQVELVIDRPGERGASRLEEHTTGLGKAIPTITPPHSRPSETASQQDLVFYQ